MHGARRGTKNVGMENMEATWPSKHLISRITQGLALRLGPRGPKFGQCQVQDERMEIKRNNEVDRLAKIATGLPLLEYAHTHLGDIVVKGGLAPTSAKWVIERRHYDLFLGTHWVSWLPLKGTR